MKTKKKTTSSLFERKWKSRDTFLRKFQKSFVFDKRNNI